MLAKDPIPLSKIPDLCLDWAFSNSRWEAWLPAFQVSIFAKCDTAERRFFRRSCLRNPCLLWNLSVHSLPEAWGCWERQFGSVASSLSAVHVRHTCLLWNRSLLSLPETWGAWERQHTLPALHCACILPIPSLQLQKKARVSFREAKRLVTEL